MFDWIHERCLDGVSRDGTGEKTDRALRTPVSPRKVAFACVDSSLQGLWNWDLEAVDCADPQTRASSTLRWCILSIGVGGLVEGGENREPRCELTLEDGRDVWMVGFEVCGEQVASPWKVHQSACRVRHLCSDEPPNAPETSGKGRENRGMRLFATIQSTGRQAVTRLGSSAS